MSDNFIINLKLINIFKLQNLNKSNSLIKDEKEKLWLWTKQYLELNGARNEFLTSPAIIERVKKIIFENLLLGENTKIYENGTIVENGKDYKQCLGVSKEGKIIFYRQYGAEKRVTLFDIVDKDVTCRFLEYDNTGNIQSEKRVIIDKYGFDYRYEELSSILKEKRRDVFQAVISSIDNDGITALSDWGSHSITDLEDEYFLGRNFSKEVEKDIELDNYFDYIDYFNLHDIIKFYPMQFQNNSKDVRKIKSNFNYYTKRYPFAEKWFIDRFGKEFLINNCIISKDCKTPEKDIFEKIEEADEYEVNQYFFDKKLSYSVLSSYARKMLSINQIRKFSLFISKMSDKEKLRFINDAGDNFEYIAYVVCNIESDEIKKKVYDEIEEDLDIEEKVLIVQSFENEAIKVEYFNDYIDQILEHDNFLLDNIDDFQLSDNYIILSEKVLDSLVDSDNLYYFFNNLKTCVNLKYEYIKDFSKTEIEDIIIDNGENLNQQDYMEIFKTKKLDDKTIINVLESNWESGFNLAKNDEQLRITEYMTETLRVFGLLCIKDIDKKLEFLDNHVDDYTAPEITEVLKDVGNSNLMLSLAKKYGLTKYYYYDLVMLCDDDKIYECIEKEEDIDEDDLVILLTSLYDIPRAFKYVENIDKYTAIDKLRILSSLETDLAENPDEIKKLKINFLKTNKTDILNNLKDENDFKDFMTFIRDFEEFDEQNEYIEDFKNSIPDFDDDDAESR